MQDLNLSMFRANDIRTPASRLPDELAQRLARAEAVYLAKIVGAPGAVLAHDARATGPHMLDIAAEEYAAAGLEVVVLPCTSGVCQLYYAAMRHPHLAAVMFGASHNPAGDTGRKMMAPGLRPIAEGLGPDGGLRALRQLYIEGAEERAQTRGAIRAFDALPGYVAYSMHEAHLEAGGLNGIRVLQDYLYGAGGREMMVGFAPTGVLLEPMHFAADGAFRLGDPNPVKQEVIAPGLRRLQEGRFDLGLFYDGDADRLDVYLGDGTYVAPSFVYAAILPLVLRDRRSARRGLATTVSEVLVDTKAGPLAEMEIARCGVQVGMVRSGHSHIKHTMYQRDSVIGAVEESAHYYGAFCLEGRRYCTENTLYYSMMVARTCREAPERLRAAAQAQKRIAREREWGHKFPTDAKRDAALEAVRCHFEADGAAVLDTVGGEPLQATLMRSGLPFALTEDMSLPDAWVQISQRASQSEDRLARWDVTAADPDTARATKKTIRAIVEAFEAGPEYQG